MSDNNDTTAPELHNSEQDNESSQAQTIAEQAQHQTQHSPTESVKGPNDSDLMGDSTQDVIDHMRDMESSGRIDMDAYRGEPNMDDDEGKYSESNKLDRDLPSDGE
ncbi:MAG: hypothetical protein ACR2PC_00540 [Tsuneonella suprasediminis]|uniref:Uncharacterized protein n=1 Tax=Tsuneonella suprasediminis TaxID=2306996 RepID=A0A419QYR1_9SPHN|nr:hypothetical protein [Tsuneonella suprasediminis]RJX65698.1 hypothetical protein D6858_15525 [Tsuneonella suprasediminis]UBS33468.1 hypothetical protein LBX01_02235 [Altererythrobacter sp. N1]